MSDNTNKWYKSGKVVFRNNSNLVSAPIMTANWNASDGEQWTVPFGGGVGKVFKLGKLPVNFNAQVYYNAVRPTVGDWQSRFQLQFMFPK